MITDAPVLGRAFPTKPGFQSAGMLLVTLAIAAVFVLDLLTPLGTAVHSLYIVILWVALAWANPRQTFAIAAAGSVLTVIGLFLSPGHEFWMSVANRAIILVVLWFLAYFGMTYRETVDTLCKRERELTDFVENAPIGIHWVAPDGTILRVNQEEINMLGYDREEYLGRCVVGFHVDREVAEDILEKLNANVPLKNRAARLRHKDGSIRHVLISCNVYQEDGCFIHSRCFTQDITDRVRAGLAQSESGQLAAANARLVAESAERRKAEQALSERAELLRVTFDSAHAGINMTALDGTFIKANAAYQHMVGYSEEDLRQMTPGSLTHEDDHPHNQALRKELIAGKRDFFEIEKRYHIRDGSVIWVHNRVSVVRDDLGKPRFFVAVVQDITGRKLAEQALRDTKDRLQAVITASPLAIVSIDHADNVMMWNPAAERIFGWTHDEVIGHPLPNVPDDQRVAFQALVKQEFQGRNSTGREVVRRRKDGSRIVVSLWTALLRDRDGESTSLVALLDDVTERKLAEDLLRQSQQNYSALVNSIDGIVWEADAQTLRFSFVSQQAQRLLGYPVESWLGESTFWKDHIHPDDREWAVDFCVTATREKRAHDFEYRMLAADGRTVWVRDIVSVAVENNQPVRLRGITVDITERKLAEKALQESEERFALFMHHLPNTAAFIKDVEGRYVYANPVSEKAMRTQPGGWWGRTDDDLYPPAAAQQCKASDHQVISDWRAIETLETFFHDDGIQHWLVRKFPIPGNTSPSPLLGGIAIDITTIKRAEEALVASQQRLHQLLEERERLSRDLHDNIIQAIYAIGMRLETCQRLLHDRPQNVTRYLTQAIGGLNSVIHDVRHYISSAEPQIPSKARLYAELERLTQSIDTMGAPRFSVKLDPLAVAQLTPQQAEHLRHITREATSNTLRHSHAKHVSLSLENTDDVVRLEISDDGVGFDPGIARRNHSGLHNMEFRAQQIGGRLEFLSSPGHGVTITLHIPKEQPAHDIQ